ncbi:MAG TPA: hypothetical protein VKU82_07815 [Planctomycetaceae bacterium]|nr:hypothetical protein [Planctomycetaceae bacterium]
MTLAAACGWSLARSLALALAAWPICKWQCQWLRGMDARPRRLAWFALMLPFLCPELWAGYAWSGFAIQLANTRFWQLFPSDLWASSPQSIVHRDAGVDELLLDLLLFFRAVPVGTLAIYFAPAPPLSAEALHCRRLALATPREHGLLARGWLGFLLRRRLHAALPAMGLMFVATFQEFELASLIGRPAWTVWLFDAQVGGLALDESLRRAALPVACQAAVLAPLVGLLVTSRSLPSRRAARSGQPNRRSQAALWCLAIAAVIVTFIVPATLIGRGTFGGLATIFRNKTQLSALTKEILVGSGYAFAAAAVSTAIAAQLCQWARIWRPAIMALVAAALPGLFGSLVLSLALIQLLQQPFVYVAYKTPLSYAAGLSLFLLPRAIVLRLLLWSSDQTAGVHVAWLLGRSPDSAIRRAARELIWHAQLRREFWSLALLTYWAYLDLTVAYLLAPATIVSAPVLLYNQMHFGKNAVLSAMTLLAVLVPALLFVLASAARPILFRWFRR